MMRPDWFPENDDETLTVMLGSHEHAACIVAAMTEKPDVLLGAAFLVSVVANVAAVIAERETRAGVDDETAHTNGRAAFAELCGHVYVAIETLMPPDRLEELWANLDRSVAAWCDRFEGDDS